MPDSMPLVSEICNRTLQVFGQRPCLWQVEVTQAVLRCDQDVVSISATGSGKTMTFWMPLLFHPQGIQIVVTPLNILGTQNVAALEKLSIKGLALHAETATNANFKVRLTVQEYRVIVTNPETLMKANGGFDKLWKNHLFTSRIISIVWDEAHCISKWGDFRPEYKLAGRLRYIIPSRIPYFITSMTLPAAVLDVITETMRLCKNTCIIHRSNDRPNVHLVVWEFQYPMSSYLDLAFLIPENVTLDWKPPKFLVFFDDISKLVAAAKFLRLRLPQPLRSMLKFVWFNAEMTPNFREEHTKNLKAGTVYGLCCTDSFGMGVDLSDIALVIQWHMSCDLCTLWQQFGCGAQDPSTEATAFLLVESKYFDRSRQKKADNRDKREQAK
ncbi:P-loop containing nucleoside triphosphate hydrolase protein, partial [Suillus subaureus]